ncbi:MAG: hypothetical protein HYU64_18065 [Armatimonadetes bacterium]|nr:hypothetical protein [Armatimonadota bacterium]
MEPTGIQAINNVAKKAVKVNPGEKTETGQTPESRDTVEVSQGKKEEAPAYSPQRIEIESKPAPAASEEPAAGPRPPKKYTILAYLDGSNDLNKYLMQNLKDMEKTGSTDDLNIVAQYSRYHTPPLVQSFFAQTLGYVFQSPPFVELLKENIKDEQTVNNLQILLANPAISEKLSLVMLQQNPELLVQLDGVTSALTAEFLNQNQPYQEMVGAIALQLAQELVSSVKPTKLPPSPFGKIAIPGLNAKELQPKIVNAIRQFADSMSRTEDGNPLVFLEPGNSSAGSVGRPEEPKKPVVLTPNNEPEWLGVRRYYVTKGEDPTVINSKPISDLGVADMASPATLADFLIWGMKNFPAEHYLVIASNHGAGFLGGLEDRGKMMDLTEFRQALEFTEKRTGAKPDAIIFDACLMSQAEVGYELKDRARYLVASEELVGGEGLPYVKIMGDLANIAKNPQSKPDDFPKAIVGRAKEEQTKSTPTMAVMDLSKMAPIKEAMDTVAKDLLASDVPKETISEAIKNTLYFAKTWQPTLPYRDYRDLGHLTEQLTKLIRALPDGQASDPPLDPSKPKDQVVSRTKVLADLEALKKAAVDALPYSQNLVDEDYEGTHGMSVYAPRRDKYTRPQIFAEYDKLAMAKETMWDEFLKKLTNYVQPEKKPELSADSMIPIPARIGTT